MTFDEWLQDFWRQQEYHHLRRRFAQCGPRSSRERKLARRLGVLIHGG